MDEEDVRVCPRAGTSSTPRAATLLGRTQPAEIDGARSYITSAEPFLSATSSLSNTSQYTAMADKNEASFVKTYAEGLSSQPVTYADDFQPPLENYLKKVPTLPVRILAAWSLDGC